MPIQNNPCILSTHSKCVFFWSHFPFHKCKCFETFSNFLKSFIPCMSLLNSKCIPLANKWSTFLFLYFKKEEISNSHNFATKLHESSKRLRWFLYQCALMMRFFFKKKVTHGTSFLFDRESTFAYLRRRIDILKLSYFNTSCRIIRWACSILKLE